MAASVRSEPEPKSDRATSTASVISPPNDFMNRASDSLGDAYCYSPLPKYGSIRLLRLMPHKDKEAPIQCQLFEYPLQEPGQGIHLYEALSYVWGSEGNQQPIYIQSDNKGDNSSASPSTGNNRRFLVTANLHAALSHVRDRLLERVLWIDALCINQKDNDEKGRQVQYMAKIYANAIRVIVWLGEAASDSDQAFEALRKVAKTQRAPPTIDKPTQKAILALLERPWFQRIWYERSLSETNLPETSLPRTFSLNIRPLSELVDMYHTRKATNPLDKVYALLGMSSDDPKTAGLLANYTTSWEMVFRKLIQFSLSDQMSVDTWDDRAMAVIQGKGHILGKVSSVEGDDTQGDVQSIGIAWKNTLGHFDTKGENNSRFALQASAKLIRAGDAVCLLQGASKPTIVRLCNGYSAIIIIAVPLTESESKWSERLRSITTSPMGFVLIWDWDVSQRKSRDRDYKSFISRQRGHRRPWTELQDYLDKVTKLWNFGVILNGMERYEDAGKNLQKAVEVYGEALRSIDNYPGHGAWIEADEEILKAMDDLVIRDKGAANDPKSFNDQTPLLWAAVNGHKAVVKLLLDKCATIETKDNKYGRTLLSLAAENGHEAVIKILLDKGAEIETKDKYGRMPLLWAAINGHEAVIKLLLDKGAVIETKDKYGQTPLSLAAENGHEAVIKLLLDKGAVIETKDKYGQTPLSLAAENGHEAVIKLLLDRGADIETKDSNSGRTPLSFAAVNGRKAVVKLLLDKGAVIETKDNSGWTPLSWAAVNGYEAVIKLLLDRGAAIETKGPEAAVAGRERGRREATANT
ncbi:hypothetical protein DL767_006892 [Monosporascus sp. MG133]|nr:hypothetical protein DL767_006892 [Monosporascus sp. MG133]